MPQVIKVGCQKSRTKKIESLKKFSRLRKYILSIFWEKYQKYGVLKIWVLCQKSGVWITLMGCPQNVEKIIVFVDKLSYPPVLVEIVDNIV